MSKSVDIRGVSINYKGNDILWQQAANGNWEAKTFDTIDRFLSGVKNPVFIDVGAWIGVFSIYAAKKYGAKVVSIEPDFSAFSSLNENLILNGVEAIPLCLAVSDKNGVVKLNSQQNSFGTSMTSMVERGEMVSFVNAQSMNLDSIMRTAGVNPNSITLMKVDVEGGETVIFEGNKDWLKYHKPTIHLSIHPAWIAKGFPEMVSTIYDLFPKILTEEMGLVEGAEAFINASEQHVHQFILMR